VVQQLAEGGGGVRPPDEGENGREVDTGQADPGEVVVVAGRRRLADDPPTRRVMAAGARLPRAGPILDL